VAPGEVRLTPGARALYAQDASNYRVVPLAVVAPRNADDVAALLQVCRHHGVPVTPRGGGTSVAGNAIGPGVILDTRHLNQIRSLDPERRIARVEPGVVLDTLRAAAAPYGLTFGPDPSTHNRCTLGGMIGNNACGAHSLAWGTTADNVLELSVMLADGTRLSVGPTSLEEFERRSALPGREGEVYAATRRLVTTHMADIRLGLPTGSGFTRQVSGYGLGHLLPERGGQLARALVGSEGTCAVVLEATVQLVPLPRVRHLVVLGFPDDCAAADAVPNLLPLRPLAIESVDAALFDVLAAHGRRPAVALPEAGAWLYVEVGADSEQEAAELAAAVTAATHTQVTGARTVADTVEQRKLWRVREDGAGLATRLPDGGEAWPGWEDAAVPPERLGDYLRDFRALLARHGRRGISYGHFGEGCIHIRIDFDMLTADGRRGFRRFLEEAADLVAHYGGSLSGEHSDGRARSELLSRIYRPELLRAFGEFKRIFDPTGLLNPGVVVDPAPLDADLRFEPPAQPQRRLPVTLALHRDGGDLDRALRRCVGVGKCRRPSGGVMCPSYMVTGEEQHSTRGRARLLYEMARGELITDGWRSEEVHQALDLCLACKGCLSDCPAGVDMATYKAEFLHHHYRGRLRPRSHYTLGWLPAWLRLAAHAPGVFNAVSRSRAAGVLKTLAGVAPERDIPTLPRQDFLRWWRNRPVRRTGERPRVVLWPDTFTRFFTPAVGRAAVAVLEAAGFEVTVPSQAVCCGLTWMSTGQLGVAARLARRTVSVLSPWIEAGARVVGLEPSCTALLRSDLPDLVPGPAARRVASSVVTLAELLEPLPLPLHPLGRRAIAQVHCHQHAVMGYAPDQVLLARAGVQVEPLDSGCCGLAGNFGFEPGHVAVSRAAGERVLLPAVRSAPEDTLILADGFSCRTQIAWGIGEAQPAEEDQGSEDAQSSGEGRRVGKERRAGRRVLHLAEVLATALYSAPDPSAASASPATTPSPEGGGPR